MENLPLPSDLQEIERDVGRRSLPKPSDCLRQRVLDDLHARLRAERSRSRWQFAAAIAATVLVWMNLSMSATQATDFGLRHTEPAESVETVARRIQQLAPELSAEESLRQAVLLRAGANLILMPDLSKTVDPFSPVNTWQSFQGEDRPEKRSR